MWTIKEKLVNWTSWTFKNFAFQKKKKETPHIGRKYFLNVIKYLYPEYVNNSYNSKIRGQTAQFFQWLKYLLWVANKHMERYSTSQSLGKY